MKTTTYKHPDLEECEAILREYGTPPHVAAHCRAVAAVGCRLASALNSALNPALNERAGRGEAPEQGAEEGGRRLDLETILAAGMLHDMARVEENHWDVAADFCAARGWTREEEVIRAHMTYDSFNDAAHLNETDIICLADRLVLEDRYAGLDRRIDYIIEKARRNDHEDYVPHILRKKEETRALLGEIEKRIGMTLDELMGAEAPPADPASRTQERKTDG